MKNLVPDLRIADFDYPLPDSRIALFPAQPRDSAKLLVYQGGRVCDSFVRNLPDYVDEPDCWVANNTQVIPARLWFETANAALIQVFLLKSTSENWSQWEAMVGNRKRFKSEARLRNTNEQGDWIEVSWENRDHNTVSLSTNLTSIPEALEVFGKVPLPPYIQRETTASDKADYQTLFAKHKGAVAAPTASLHFTPELRSALMSRGMSELELTLHVGAGTFKPVSAERISEHEMHAERFVVSSDLLKGLLKRGRGVIALGTTSLRVLESLYYLALRLHQNSAAPCFVAADDPYKKWELNLSTREALQFLYEECEKRGGELQGETQIFIVPGFQFRIADRLLTNFHQPKSTLLVLISAFIGQNWKDLYGHALAQQYRFLSYGDASLLSAEKKLEW
jgi:S-adenosylmethionine:tRNA ribosyltransferase-isomerase